MGRHKEAAGLVEDGPLRLVSGVGDSVLDHILVVSTHRQEMQVWNPERGVSYSVGPGKEALEKTTLMDP